MIGNRIREVRKENNYNQSQMAGLLGISQAYLSRVESGQNEPSDLLMHSICREFNLNEEWLLHGTGNKYNQASIDMMNLMDSARGANPSDKDGNLKAQAIGLSAQLFEIYPNIAASCDNMEQFLFWFRTIPQFAEIFNITASLFLQIKDDHGADFQRFRDVVAIIGAMFPSDKKASDALRQERIKSFNQDPLARYLHDLFLDDSKD